LRFGSGGPDCVLPSPLRGRLSLQRLFLCALRLASRLAKLLFRLSQLVLQLLQVALEIADLTLDRVDPVSGNVLCVGRGRYQRGAERYQRAAVRLVPISLPPLMAKLRIGTYTTLQFFTPLLCQLRGMIAGFG
jgi:uncharacterized protein involved in type VI secretion and phage assembly